MDGALSKPLPTVPPLLEAELLSVSAGTRELVTHLSIAFRPGEFVAVLGRNGCGKTLTLHTLAGLRPAREGGVKLEGQSFQQMNRRAVAQRLGVLTQDLEEGFSTTVLESVLLGRHPHLSLWQWEGAEDELIARRALEDMSMLALADRQTHTLSGGEQRRVAVAALLAQNPAIFLLDEPTNHLDPHHQLAVLGLFRKLADAGRAVVATLHDASLAARFADRVVLLFGDGRWISGPADEVLTARNLSELYLTTILEAHVAGHRIFVSQ